MNRLCYFCRAEKPDADFTRSEQREHKGRPVGRCRLCTSQKNKLWRKMNPEKAKENNKKRREDLKLKEYDRVRAYPRKYGISIEQYEELRASQNFKCYICKIDENKHKASKWRSLCVDHDHKTGKVRALLCDLCNKGLGMFRDNIDFLKNAASYLEEFSPK